MKSDWDCEWANNESINETSSYPHDSKRSQNKRITFKNKDEIILIPSISDYRDFGDSDSIWSSKEELHDIKMTAFAEILNFMDIHKCKNAREALKLMFNNDDEAVFL